MGSETHSVQMVSMTHCSLKAESLKTALAVGTVGTTHILRTEDAVRSLQLSGYSLLRTLAVTSS